jgi:chaperone modulatory protein CbpM
MADAQRTVVEAVIVEDELRFTLADLCRACSAQPSFVVALVDEGLLHPSGSGPDDWQFEGTALARARTAWRLARDLELGVEAMALVLGLLDEIDALEKRLRRAGLP